MKSTIKIIIRLTLYLLIYAFLLLSINSACTTNSRAQITKEATGEKINNKR